MQPGGPKPLDPYAMDPDSYALAVALREQFAKIGLGVRAYAKDHHLDASTVSRSLRCASAVPTWQFIEELVAHAAATHNLPTDPAELRGLHELYEKALASSSAKGHVVGELRSKIVRTQIEAAGREAAVARLEHDLQEANQANLRLEAELTALQGLADEGRRPGKAALESAGLVAERNDVEAAIADLNRQLAREIELKEEAQKRCQALEDQLEMYLRAGAPKEERDTTQSTAAHEDDQATVTALSLVIKAKDAAIRDLQTKLDTAHRAVDEKSVADLLEALKDSGKAEVVGRSTRFSQAAVWSREEVWIGGPLASTGWPESAHGDTPQPEEQRPPTG